ncbi:zeatin O-glucosyltransferase [Citrus clementina]|uniref:zeatin O-glucosyltransferase n=1 Tax=Citrus clementina TaxID=85681 RepID=UPI000CED4654|nr:zeatin O-glucosyltransferase [Citrus x clementina]
MNGIDLLDINRIQFHDCPIPHFLSPPPNPRASIKFPTHLQIFEACMHLRQPITALIHTLSLTANRIIIIHDALLASVVQDATYIPNSETYVLHCTSAFTSFFNLWGAPGKPFQIEDEVPNDLPSLEGCFAFEAMNVFASQAEFMKLRAGDFLNTSRSMERTYIDLLQQINEIKKLWAIGRPLHPVTICRNKIPIRQEQCLNWLDKQAPKSVVYISFGTTSTTDEQINELAIGLEESKTKFTWVLRDADKGDIFAEKGRRVEFPHGFEARMEGVGIVIRAWVTQLEILGHPSTGGFMNLCGWNSCM